MTKTTKGQTMEASATRTVSAARIVALALIAAVVGGLAYVHLASGDDRVSVPKGAHAGQLKLHDCTYGTEDGGYAADCGTLVVPENRADPKSRLIAVEVKRIHARSAHPAEPIFRLEGGPGITNMSFAKASRYAGTHDVVLVGYRGIDSSTRLDCPEVESALGHSTDFLGQKSFRSQSKAFRACAARLTGDGVDLGGYGVLGQVGDLEAARKAFGYDRIDLLSESAGTRTALIYAERHPGRVHRSVMIGVNPPGHFLWSSKVNDEQIAAYARHCAQDATCSRRTSDLAATIRKTAADMPGRFWGLPVDRSTVLVASEFGMHETTQETAPLTGPMTLGSWLSAANGDASGFWLQSLTGKLLFPKAFVWGQYAAFGRVDAEAARRHFAAGGLHPKTDLADAATTFVWADGKLTDSWPAQPGENAYSRVRPSRVPTLLIGGELDFSTPPQNAKRELLPHLANGRQVVLKGFGHSTSFWTQQRDAGTHLVETFLDTGRVDTSRYEPQRVDFTPEVTQTALGKGVAGTILGLAGLTVLSLAWMAIRVLRRGGYGRKSSAALRSVWAFVLGLGGWFTGVIAVTTAFPSVPLDDPLLATLSIGLPVGLGVYLAWLRRDDGTAGVGLAAAVAGALAGAWLGFHAATDLLALVTSIFGAIAGANLLLVGLDLTRTGRAPETEAVSTAIAVVES